MMYKFLGTVLMIRFFLLPLLTFLALITSMHNVLESTNSVSTTLNNSNQLSVIPGKLSKTVLQATDQVLTRVNSTEEDLSDTPSEPLSDTPSEPTIPINNTQGSTAKNLSAWQTFQASIKQKHAALDNMDQEELVLHIKSWIKENTAKQPAEKNTETQWTELTKDITDEILKKLTPLKEYILQCLQEAEALSAQAREISILSPNYTTKELTHACKLVTGNTCTQSASSAVSSFKEKIEKDTHECKTLLEQASSLTFTLIQAFIKDPLTLLSNEHQNISWQQSVHKIPYVSIAPAKQANVENCNALQDFLKLMGLCFAQVCFFPKHAPLSVEKALTYLQKQHVFSRFLEEIEKDSSFKDKNFLAEKFYLIGEPAQTKPSFFEKTPSNLTIVIAKFYNVLLTLLKSLSVGLNGNSQILIQATNTAFLNASSGADAYLALHTYPLPEEKCSLATIQLT